MFNLEQAYAHRFSESELEQKNAIWKVLCQNFFQKYVRSHDDVVVDCAAGYGEFINHIRCGRKIAIDLNPDVKKFVNPDVEVINQSCLSVNQLSDGIADVVFMSNFLEHLHSKEEVLQCFRECKRLLKPGGRILVLQPNIRLVKGAYWDFFDHHVPLTEKSLGEALVNCGFRVEEVIVRFLPYTTKGKLPKYPFLIKLFLALPFFWKFFGRQSFLVAKS